MLLVDGWMCGAIVCVSNGRADHQRVHGIITGASTARHDQRPPDDDRHVLLSLLLKRRAHNAGPASQATANNWYGTSLKVPPWTDMPCLPFRRLKIDVAI